MFRVKPILVMQYFYQFQLSLSCFLFVFFETFASAFFLMIVPANIGTEKIKLNFVTGAYDLSYGGAEHFQSLKVAGLFFLIIGIIPLAALFSNLYIKAKNN